MLIVWNLSTILLHSFVWIHVDASVSMYVCVCVCVRMCDLGTFVMSDNSFLKLILFVNMQQSLNTFRFILSFRQELLFQLQLTWNAQVVGKTKGFIMNG